MKWNPTSGYLSFLRSILLFSFVLGLIATGLAFWAPARFITPALPWLFLFFLGSTLAGYYFILHAVNTKFIRFINTYLLVTVVKLFVFIGILFLYLWNNREDAAPFAIAFFILYLCYMIFEVVNLVSYFKSIQK
jgi:hypothetical protein